MVLGACWFSAPAVIRWQINKKPGVHVDGVELLVQQKCLVLKDVVVDREWVNGRFPSATVCGGTVNLPTGEITASLDSKKTTQVESTGAEKYKITAQHLSLHITKDGVRADLEDTSVSEGEVCAVSTKVTHSKGRGIVKNLCVKRNRTELKFTEGVFHPTSKLFGYETGPIQVGPTTVDLGAQSASVSNVEVKGVTATEVRVGYRGGLASGFAETLRLRHDRLHTEPLTFSKVEVGPLDPTKAVEGDLAVKISGVTLRANLKEHHLWGAETCQAWYQAVPIELRTGPLKDLTFTGDFQFDLRTKPVVKLDWKLTCKSPSPEPSCIKALRAPFTYTAFDKEGREFSRKTGPGSQGWVPFEAISPNMVTALQTTEDPSFFEHKGFLLHAVENSLVANLKAGRAVRGASTLTMQLAKNLWLRRSKTIGRKVQESFLTIVLESHLKKEEILELYLNVVEFGPDLYGIGPAAKELVGVAPMHLSLSDSLSLTLRLPRPTKAGSFDSSKATVRALLEQLRATGKVPEDLITVESTIMESP